MKEPIRHTIEDAFEELVQQFRWLMKEGDGKLESHEIERGKAALHDLAYLIAAIKLRYTLER